MLRRVVRSLIQGVGSPALIGLLGGLVGLSGCEATADSTDAGPATGGGGGQGGAGPTGGGGGQGDAGPTGGGGGQAGVTVPADAVVPPADGAVPLDAPLAADLPALPDDAPADAPAPPPTPDLAPLDVGVPDASVSVDACQGMAWYGPQPCESDAQCVEWNGAGWICDPDHAFDSPCGPVSWPMCVQAPIDAGVPPPPDLPCVPMAVYGPRPCGTDDECVQDYGPGWYCDHENAFDNGCGQMSVWPICRER